MITFSLPQVSINRRSPLPPYVPASVQSVFAWPDISGIKDKQPSLLTVIANGNITRKFPSVIRLHPGTYRPAIIRADALSQTGKITIQSLNPAEQRAVFSAVSAAWIRLPPVPPANDDGDALADGWKVTLHFPVFMILTTHACT